MSEGYQEPFTVYRARSKASEAGAPPADQVLTTSTVSLNTLGAQPILSSSELAEQQAAQPLTQQQREQALDDLRKAIMSNLGGKNNG